MYNSIQDFITFSNEIYDAIADHLAYEVHTGTEVLCISPTLQVCIHQQPPSKSERYHPIQPLLRKEDGILVPDGEEIDDIASQYMFVH